MSQASTLGGGQGGGGGSAPPQSAPAMRVGGQRTVQRKKPASTSRSKPTRGGDQNRLMQFYTEEAPGLKVGPTTVLILALVLMCVVVLAHILNKVSQLGGPAASTTAT